MKPGTPDADRQNLSQQQAGFAAYIRDPDGNPVPPGVEPGRMALYRELFFNNTENLIATSFPVLRSLLDDAHWQAMVSDFLARHRCATPLFYQMPQEFLTYLSEVRGTLADDPPFLLELAHYEWVEVVLWTAPETIDLPVDTRADLLAGAPIISPLVWSLAYRYPVHRISTDFQPTAPDGTITYLLVYRDRNDDVGFMEINQVTARLLELLNDGSRRTGLQALQQVAQELRHPDPSQVVEAGRAILEDLRTRDVVIGTGA